MKKWLQNSWIVTGLFGYNNFKFVITELVKILSDKPSYFSQKRIKANIAFVAALVVLLGHAWFTRNEMTTMEACEIGLILLGVAGYMVNKTQKEKLGKVDESE